MADVFISSWRTTAALARRIARQLETKGYTCLLSPWYQLSTEHNGNLHYPEELTHESGAFVVLVEPVSKVDVSYQLRREWFFVLQELNPPKRLIPVVVGRGDPPGFVWGWELVRIRDRSSARECREAVEAIVRALESGPMRADDRFIPERIVRKSERRLDEMVAFAERMKAQAR